MNLKPQNETAVTGINIIIEQYMAYHYYMKYNEYSNII